MRYGTSARPRNGCQYSSGCSQSGNSGSGIVRPENTITTPVITVLKPRPDNVQINATCISMVIADASATVAVNEIAKQTAAAVLAGGGKAHFPRPNSGSRKPAKRIIGIM